MVKLLLTEEQYDFTEKIQEKLVASSIGVEKVNFRPLAGLKGRIYFNDISFYYNFENLFEEYEKNPNIIDQFIEKLGLWKTYGDKIKNIYKSILSDNDLEIPIRISLYEGFCYSPVKKELFGGPAKITEKLPIFVKPENLDDYLISVCLHEVGHYMEHSETNLFKEKKSLTEKIKQNEISELEFFIEYRKIELEMEYRAWEWAKKLKHSFNLDETFFERTRAYCLSTYDENSHLSGIYALKRLMSTSN